MIVAEPVHMKHESVYSQITKKSRGFSNLGDVIDEETEPLSRIQLKLVDYKVKASEVNIIVFSLIIYLLHCIYIIHITIYFTEIMQQ